MIDQVIDAASKLKEKYASDATVVLSLVTTVMRNHKSKGQLKKVKEMIRMSPLGKMFYDEMEQKLEQKDAELAQKDAALAQKDAALEQKDAALEQKDAALEQKDKEYASFLVSAIDALVRCQMKLEDACATLGKKTADYMAAKAMLAGV
ncbi:MAG: hypothetical protein IJT77_04395 [Clostridia bacterium]|nr:hypothetical protein [Clostridia bacterium]